MHDHADTQCADERTQTESGDVEHEPRQYRQPKLTEADALRLGLTIQTPIEVFDLVEEVD